MKIFNENCIPGMKKLKESSIDLIVTDPPYGLKFMGKKWDKALPPKEAFKEMVRVLQPGAFAFTMCTPRSDLQARMSLLLENAGFNIGFTPIYWTYATGFPKAQNISKQIDKRKGAKRETYLKPIAYPDSECWGIPNNNISSSYEATSYNTNFQKVNKGNGMREDSLPAKLLTIHNNKKIRITIIKPFRILLCPFHQDLNESRLTITIYLLLLNKFLNLSLKLNLVLPLFLSNSPPQLLQTCVKS